MKRETYFKLFLLTLLFLLIHGIGCGTAKSVYRASADTVKAVSEKIMPEEGPVLKKRVLVIPIIDQAGAGESNLSQFSNRLADLLKENDNLLVTFLKESVTSQSRKMSSQFGMVIDKELIQRADEMEMDILVVTNLNPFDIKAKKRGIWPFRKLKQEVGVSVTMEVLDVINGALILCSTEAKKVKANNEVSEDQAHRWEVDNQVLEEGLSPILKNQSEMISDTLDTLSWTGKITIADNRNVRINGGTDIGIAQGNVFEVFGKGESIRSLSGKDYRLLGPKIGEVSADEVTQKYSVVVPLNDEKLEDGQFVRLKR